MALMSRGYSLKPTMIIKQEKLSFILLPEKP